WVTRAPHPLTECEATRAHLARSLLRLRRAPPDVRRDHEPPLIAPTAIPASSTCLRCVLTANQKPLARRPKAPAERKTAPFSGAARANVTAKSAMICDRQVTIYKALPPDDSLSRVCPFGRDM